MTFVPIVNCWRISMVYRYTTSQLLAVNTFGVYDPVGPFDATRAATWANTFKSWWSTNVKAYVHTGCQLEQINVVDESSSSGTSIQYVTGLPIVGTDANGAAPQDSAPVITWRTASRGRSYRGRTYHVGAAKNMFTVDGTAVDTALAGSLGTAYTALIAAIPAASATCSLVVLSKTLASHTDILTAQGRTHIGSQRRRVTSP